MDYNKNRLSVKCECGHQLTASDIVSLPEKCKITGYYGGRVTHFADLVCPDCGHRYVGCLKAVNNSYRVIDSIDNGEKKKTRKKVASTERNL